MSPRTRLLASCALLALCASCTSIEFTRETQTSGRFVSRATAVTLFSYDIPAAALITARDNASDARLSNMVVEEAIVRPRLGWFDWVFDIVGIRWAKVTGTWGFPGESTTAARAN